MHSLPGTTVVAGPEFTLSCTTQQERPLLNRAILDRYPGKIGSAVLAATALEVGAGLRRSYVWNLFYSVTEPSHGIPMHIKNVVKPPRAAAQCAGRGTPFFFTFFFLP